MSRDMEPPRSMTTYKRADGEMVCGEFGWVNELDFFDNEDQPVEVIEEVWALVSRKTFWIPDHLSCQECGENVPIPAGYTQGSRPLVLCPSCLSDPPCSECGWERSHIRHIDAALHNFHNYKDVKNLPEDWGEPSPGER